MHDNASQCIYQYHDRQYYIDNAVFPNVRNASTNYFNLLSSDLPCALRELNVLHRPVFLFTITYVLHVSPAQFNHFGESMFTMFRLATLDNWYNALRDSQVGGGGRVYSCKCVLF